MKRMIIILFVMFGVAHQVNAMSRPSYGNKPVGIQRLLNSHKQFLLHRDKRKREIERVKEEINRYNVLNIQDVSNMVVAMHGDDFLIEINKDYNVELNQLAQEKTEALRDMQRLAYVASSKISDADKAPHIPVVIHQAKEKHEINVYWLDPKDREIVIQGCNGDVETLRKTKDFFVDRLNELAAANEQAYKKIEDKMTLFQTPEYQQNYIHAKGELLIKRELDAMPSATIAELLRKDKINRE